MATGDKPSLFLATPCYGGLVTHQYAQSVNRLSRLALRDGIDMAWHTLGNESLVQRARNRCVAEFLRRKDFTHLMFIDADIEFDEAHVLAMLAESHEDPDCAVIGGAYPKKEYSWEEARIAATMGAGHIEPYACQYVINFFRDDAARGEVELTNGCRLKVKDLGTGFMLIRRDAIEKLIAAMPEIAYDNDTQADGATHYAVFDCAIDTDETGQRRYLSEDYLFCRRLQKMGIGVWLYVEATLNHVGTHVFRGCIDRVLSR